NVSLSRRRASAGTLTDTWFDHDYDTDDFVADWSTLAARYRDRPNVIGCDLESNLGGKSTWGGDDPTYDWRSAAERAGNAVLAVNPNVLVIIEGVDQAEGASYWPGGNLQGVRTNPVTLTLPNHLVYATQDFPSTISDKPFGGVPWFSAPDYPANLPAVWDANWGYLMREKIAPVFLAAFGTALAATSSDSQWLSSLETYTAQFGMSFAYFALNPQTEMPDVGGIYASFESNALNQPLISALAPMLPP
ncbi:MAG TPA: cellulase family glycosylhydrolase, partial [Polyangiaceae bacterium]|nr:cellulase family glycosylhydrolase [Polyangiaceae bacterium]